MRNNLKFGLQLELNGDQVVIRGLDGTRTAINQLDDTVNRQVRSAQVATQANYRYADSFGSLRGLAQSATGALAAMGIYLSADQILGYADATKLVNNQLRQVTASEIELLAVRQQVVGVAKDTNTDLQATVDLYQGLYRSTRSLGTAQSDVLGVTETINNLFKAGGKTAAETAGAILQLNQGLQSGALRGDEFNSVAEGAPRILDAISQSTGIAKGELRDFAAEGGITAEILINALKGYSEEAQKAADLTEETFGQKMVNARTNMIEYAETLDGANSVIDGLGDGIESLTANLDTVATMATVAGALITTHFVAPVVAGYGKAAVAQANYLALQLRNNELMRGSTHAEKQHAAALLDKAKAQATATAAEVAGYKATLQSVQAELNATLVTHKALQTSQAQETHLRKIVALRRDLAAATAALTKAETANTTATNAHTAATTRYNRAAAAATVQSRVLTTAAKGLNAALGLVGGPTGAAMLAGFALYSFIDSLETADEKSQRLSESVNAVNRELEDMTVKQAKVELIKAKASIEELQKIKDAATDTAVSAQNAFNVKSENNITFLDGIFGDLEQRQNELDIALAAEEKAIINLEKALKLRRDLESVIGGTYEAPESEDSNEPPKTSTTVDPEAERIRQRLALIQAENTLLNQGVAIDEARYKAALGFASALEGELLTAEFQQRQLLDVLRQQQAAEDERLRIAERLRAELEETTRDFTISIGLDLDDSAIANLADQFDGLDDLASLFDGIGQSGEDAIDNIVKATKAFSAAEQARGKDSQSAWSAYAEGAAFSLQGVQALSDQGSKSFEVLGVAISALNTISAIQAVLNQGSGDPYTAFARMAAMAAAVASLGVQLQGTFGGSSDDRDIAAERQAAQGTGTVFGDAEARSESISNSLELLTSINEDMLGVNRAMLQNLRAIRTDLLGVGNLVVRYSDGLNASDGIRQGTELTTLGGIANDLYRLNYLIDPLVSIADTLDFLDLGLGGFIESTLGGIGGSIAGGLFGETSTSITDTGFGLLGQRIADVVNTGIAEGFAYSTTRIRTESWFDSDTEYRDSRVDLEQTLETQFGLVIGNIYNVVEGAVSDLYGANASTLETLANYELEEFQISLHNLSAEEQLEAIEAEFSRLADTLAVTALPAIHEFADIGEGAFETLVRLSSQVQVLTNTMDDLGMVFDGNGAAIARFGYRVTPEQLAQSRAEALINASDDLVSRAGGFEQFATNIASYFDAMLSDEEKLQRTANYVDSIFDSLNIAAPQSREALANVVAALDLTTIAGRETFTAITENAELLSDYFAELETIAEAAYDFGTAFDLNDGTQPLRDALASVGLNYDWLETLAAESGIDGLRATFADLSEAQQAVLEPFTNELLSLVSSVEELSSAAERLRDFAAGVNSNLNSPQQNVSSLLTAYHSAINAVVNGDASQVTDVTSIGQQLINSAANTAASELEYQRIVAEVANAANAAADVLAPQTDIAEQQLDVLVDIRDNLRAAPAVTTASSSGADLGSNSVIARLRSLEDRFVALNNDQNTGMAAIARSTNRTARLLERWDDGDALVVRGVDA